MFCSINLAWRGLNAEKSERGYIPTKGSTEVFWNEMMDANTTIFVSIINMQHWSSEADQSGWCLASKPTCCITGMVPRPGMYPQRMPPLRSVVSPRHKRIDIRYLLVDTWRTDLISSWGNYRIIWAHFNIKPIFLGIDITIMIRGSQDHLIFMIGIPILLRWHLYIDDPMEVWQFCWCQLLRHSGGGL